MINKEYISHVSDEMENYTGSIDKNPFYKAFISNIDYRYVDDDDFTQAGGVASSLIHHRGYLETITSYINLQNANKNIIDIFFRYFGIPVLVTETEEEVKKRLQFINKNVGDIGSVSTFVAIYCDNFIIDVSGLEKKVNFYVDSGESLSFIQEYCLVSNDVDVFPPDPENYVAIADMKTFAPTTITDPLQSRYSVSLDDNDIREFNCFGDPYYVFENRLIGHYPSVLGSIVVTVKCDITDEIFEFMQEAIPKFLQLGTIVIINKEIAQ